MDNNGVNTSEIDFVKLFNIFWNKKKFIFLFTSFVSIVSVIVSLLLTNLYQSSATLDLSSRDDSGGVSSAMSQYSGLASLAGISLPSSDTDKGPLVISTIKSRDFFKILLLSDENILQNIIAANGYDFKSKKIIYNKRLFDSKKKIWTSNKGIPSYLDAHKEFIDNILNIYQDKKTQFINISITHTSPIFAKEFLNMIIFEVNNSMREKDLKESKLAIEYLTDLSANTNIITIKESIDKILENQMKTRMLATIQEDYIIQIIDSPFVPEKKSWPSRTKICIFGFLIGLITSMLVTLILNRIDA